MKQLLANMNFARWMMAVSLLLSIVLAVTGVRLHNKRRGMEDALQGSVPNLAQQIQVLSVQYSKLSEEAARDGFVGQSDPMTYFRSLATDNKVMLGGTDITKLAPFTPSKGVVDVKYVIKPDKKDRGFDRKNISNYLWLIEERSRRVRVTHVRLDPDTKSDPWAYPSDRWKWEIEVTSRQKDG